jgi:hypothetical protein
MALVDATAHASAIAVDKVRFMDAPLMDAV